MSTVDYGAFLINHKIKAHKQR